MRARSPAGLGRGAPGLGTDNMSCGERLSGEDLRANSAGMVVSEGLAGAKGCWKADWRPRRRRAASANHMASIIDIGCVWDSPFTQEIATREKINVPSETGTSSTRPSPRPRHHHAPLLQATLSG